MSCVQCASNNEAEFPTELVFHFFGLQGLDKPGIFLYPKILVCYTVAFRGSRRPQPKRHYLRKTLCSRSQETAEKLSTYTEPPQDRSRRSENHGAPMRH